MLVAIVPFLIVVQMLQLRFHGWGAQKSQDSIAQAGKMAAEAIGCVCQCVHFGSFVCTSAAGL